MRYYAVRWTVLIPMVLSDPSDHDILQHQVTRKWYTTELCLQWQTNRKSYMIYQTVPINRKSDMMLYMIYQTVPINRKSDMMLYMIYQTVPINRKSYMIYQTVPINRKSDMMSYMIYQTVPVSVTDQNTGCTFNSQPQQYYTTTLSKLLTAQKL